MVGLLAEARRRGYSFDEAWRLTVEGGGRTVLTNDPRPPELAVRWQSDRDDRVISIAAIVSCRRTFERAYRREPATASDRAVLILHEMLAEPERSEKQSPAIWVRRTGPSRPRGLAHGRSWVGAAT